MADLDVPQKGTKKLQQKVLRLFTVPCFSVGSWMSIVEFDGPPSWSLDAGEAGKSAECPWVVTVRLIAWG